MRGAARGVRAARRALLALSALLAAALLLQRHLATLAPPRTEPHAVRSTRATMHQIKPAVLPVRVPTADARERAARRPWFLRGGRRRPAPHERPPLFPEEAPGDDRIETQLMYAPPDQEGARNRKILLANGVGAWGALTGRAEFIKNKCPVNRCELTTDLREAASADAVLFKDHHIALNTKRPLNQIWILYYLECPYHTASLRAPDAFNWTATYRRDSDIVAPYERWVYHDPAVRQLEVPRNYAANKTKKVAWFVSNCHARNRRLQYARQLARHISVDVYGACGAHRCPRADPQCLSMLAAHYKFYLAFENSNCKDYITEKFFVNGLGHDVLPIVMGARPSEYEAVAPHNSYIHVEEFQSPAELAEYLHMLDRNDDLYNSYFKWKETGEFINTYFFCRVCAMVEAAARGAGGVRRYGDVHAWWRNRTCTRSEWREDVDTTRDTLWYVNPDVGRSDSRKMSPTMEV